MIRDIYATRVKRKCLMPHRENCTMRPLSNTSIIELMMTEQIKLNKIIKL